MGAELASSRQRLLPQQHGVSARRPGTTLPATYASGHANVILELSSDFGFSQAVFRSLGIAATREWIAAACPAKETPRGRTGESASSPCLPGKLLIWDIHMQQLLRSWDLSEDMNIQSLSPGPAGAFVLTAPDLCLFNITTGNVRRPPLNGPWSLAPEHLPGGRVSLAVATAGKPLAISRVLSFLEGNDLAAGTTGYDDYEAEVTAVAFANKHPILAFAVRERAGHRVFLVDPSNMDGTQMQCVEFYPHARPWFRVPRRGTGSSRRHLLAFSPDDSLLVTHGQYETTDFRLN